MAKGLWKTTIVIWSEVSALEEELEDLAREATSGNAYCSRYRSTFVQDARADSDWDGTEFFDHPWSGDEEEDVTHHRRWVRQLDQGDRVIFTSSDENKSLDGAYVIQFIEQVDDDIWHVVFTDGTDIQVQPGELSAPTDEE